jgi:hypothetical protein
LSSRSRRIDLRAQADPFAVACIQTAIDAELFAAFSDTS